MITRQTVAEKIHDYLNHRITLAQLVLWCENIMHDADVAEQDIEVVSEVAARIGVADVNNFGLLWNECDEMLHKLGYELNFDLKKVA